MKKAIVLNNLKHSFNNKIVLNNINLSVEEGEIFGLLGPSGAGKTTLINIITCQLRCSDGSSKVFEHDSYNLSADDYKKIGVMMDNFGLYERLNCYDNLKFYQMVDGNDFKNIDEILTKVGLYDAKKTNVSNLSKGMKNRLAFARAVIRKPKILFLDEPTSGLDPTTIEAIHKMILEEKKKGTTIFLTTHNMYEAEKLCDNIALLNEGNIVEYGKPKEICRRYNHQKKFKIHLNNGEDIELNINEESAELIKEYIINNKLETIHSTEPNLETIFMELTGKEFDK